MHSSLPPSFGLVRLADRMNKQSKFFDVPLVLWCSEGLLLAVARIRGRVGGFGGFFSIELFSSWTLKKEIDSNQILRTSLSG